MSEPRKSDDDVIVAEKRPYEPPKVTWREPYEVTAFAVSCAKQEGILAASQALPPIDV